MYSSAHHRRIVCFWCRPHVMTSCLDQALTVLKQVPAAATVIMSENEHDKPHQAVRFNSENETIEPERSLEQIETLTSPPKRESRDDLTEEAQEELKNLSITLQKSRLQTKRMENFAYEPVSLPPSRVSYIPPSAGDDFIISQWYHDTGAFRIQSSRPSIRNFFSKTLSSCLCRPNTSSDSFCVGLARSKSWR